jgi:hypothetical protein
MRARPIGGDGLNTAMFFLKYWSTFSRGAPALEGFRQMGGRPAWDRLEASQHVPEVEEVNHVVDKTSQQFGHRCIV